MKIEIKTILQGEQRYKTLGDYWIDENGVWQIRVSQMNNWVFEMAVIIHELWEMALCYYRGIDEKYITEFDKNFELERKEGNTDEPGDSVFAPYNREHCSATGIERLFISETGKSWQEYEEAADKIL